MKRIAILWLAVVSLVSAGLFAQADRPEREADKPKEAEKKEPVKPAPEVPPVTTSHQILVHGAVLRYTTTAGYLPMKDEEGKLKANIFFVAYTKEGEGPRRPVTFAFNGGPGSSSVWLHLGALGPRRVALTDEGMAVPPPYRLVDNDETWLAFTDLVFIDPVTTGYSRPATGEKPEQFHGVKEDVESVGDFIRLYTTRYGRWSSPKYLAGESYGTTRAAGLSGYLQDRHGMYLNGISLISTVLNFQTLEFNPGNDLPCILFLPTYTATAWYHRKLAPDLQKDLKVAVEESERFAFGDYALALLRGDRLPEPERRKTVETVSRLTGLPHRIVEEGHLCVTDGTFFSELEREESRTVGRLDTRFEGALGTPGEGISSDPSYSAILGPYTAMLNAYVRGELKYENDLPYEILTGRVGPWNFGSAQNRYVNVAETLREAIEHNPALHVFIAAGYYDAATPFAAAEYTAEHLKLEPRLRGNIRIDYFEAGHMMYIHKPSRERLAADAAQFYREATGSK
jgi:carboxypeptidase C (cathepsin A)